MNTALPISGRYPAQVWARMIGVPADVPVKSGVFVDAAQFWRQIERLEHPETRIGSVLLNPPKKAK